MMRICFLNDTEKEGEIFLVKKLYTFQDTLMIIVIKKDGLEHCINPKNCLQQLGFTWLHQLQFASSKIFLHCFQKTCVAIKKNKLSRQEIWLGSRFQRDVLEGAIPHVFIKWINSNIGYGLFATQDLPKESYIGHYSGMVRKHAFSLDYGNNYVFEYTTRSWTSPYVIDAKTKGNHTRFINHSDQNPNVFVVTTSINGVMHTLIVSKRKIYKGEQLLQDYGAFFWRHRENECTSI